MMELKKCYIVFSTAILYCILYVNICLEFNAALLMCAILVN